MKPIPPQSASNQLCISIVIPVYNSADILPFLIKQIAKSLNTTKYEIILVNDASPDRSWEVISTLQQQYPFIKGINLKHNVGQHLATYCGMQHCRYPYCITMDDDLQNLPSDIIKLAELLQKGYDLVYGDFFYESNPGFKKWVSLIFKQIIGICIVNKFTRHFSSFRGINLNKIAQFTPSTTLPFYLDYHLSKSAKKITFISVKHQPRYAGKTNYSFYKLLKHGGKLLISNRRMNYFYIILFNALLLTLIGYSYHRSLMLFLTSLSSTILCAYLLANTFTKFKSSSSNYEIIDFIHANGNHDKGLNDEALTDQQ